MSFADCLATASATAGWEWPSRFTAMPPTRSMYSLPWSSTTVSP